VSELELQARLLMGLRIALASAADISCLEICSRTSKSRNTWSIILKVCFSHQLLYVIDSFYQGGKLLYTGAAVRWKRETPGTAICIRDAFYNVGNLVRTATK